MDIFCVYGTEFLHHPSFLQLLRANLCIVKELGDRAAQGRTYGNLGNTYYLLGNFRDAMASHEQVSDLRHHLIMVIAKNSVRLCKSTHCTVCDPSVFQRLLIAKEFGDRSAERRAYCNLGNACIFLGEFERAAEHYW